MPDARHVRQPTDLRWEVSLWLLMSPEELERKLKVERRRALQGHWTYDPSRHRVMREVYRAVKSNFAPNRAR